MRLVVSLLYLALPLLCTGDEKVKYLCDFENGDCGVTSEPNSGAYMALTEVRIAEKRTTGLALQDLPKTDNWDSTRTRTATIWTPKLEPVSPGLMTVSLDYFLVGRTCVDSVRFGQLVDDETVVLGQLGSVGVWKNYNATLLYTEEPLVLVLKVQLQPSCKTWKDCKCSGQVVIDNIRVTWSDEDQFRRDYLTDEAHDLDDLLSQLEAEPTLSPTSETPPNRDSVTISSSSPNSEDPDTHERQEQQPDPRSYPDYWGHSKQGRPTPRICKAPVCPGPSGRVQFCPSPPGRVCMVVPRPQHCFCEYARECPVHSCPRVLPCPEVPRCPDLPPQKSGYTSP